MTDGLVAALARCQAKFPAIVKSHINPAFKGSQYADVADVLAAVRPVLAAEGIVVSQSTVVDKETGGVTLVTLLTSDDDDDQFDLVSEFPLYVAGLTAQQVGSLLTYHRRYQLCAILGVHPVGDDDDGNLAATAQTARPNVVTQGLSGAPAQLPDDWETRPLATMTFAELRGVAEKLGHAFSGGSKSELIRQLEPLVRAASGDEPFDVPEHRMPRAETDAESVIDRATADAIPFEPVLAKKQADAVRRGGE